MEISEEEQKKIIRFIKALQDPESGNLYHPQWLSMLGTICDVMTPGPVAVQKDVLVAEVLRILEKRRIDDIVVVN